MTTYLQAESKDNYYPYQFKLSTYMIELNMKKYNF